MWRVRTFVALAVLATLAGAGALLYLLLRPEPEVTLTTMLRIGPGVTEADVADVLGPPTADLTARPPPVCLSRRRAANCWSMRAPPRRRGRSSARTDGWPACARGPSAWSPG
jgi:hypothetical protein